MAEPLTVDWSSAEMQAGTLTVALSTKPPKGWRGAFEAAAALLATERHGVALDARKARVSVTDVVAGEEDRVRALVEGLVLQANSSLVDDDELYGRSSAEDGESDGEVDGDDREAPSPDREVAARFQAFADCSGSDADD